MRKGRKFEIMNSLMHHIYIYILIKSTTDLTVRKYRKISNFKLSFCFIILALFLHIMNITQWKKDVNGSSEI